MKLWAVHFKAGCEHKGRIFSDHEVIIEADTDTQAVRIAVDRFNHKNPFASTPVIQGVPTAVELESIYVYNDDQYRIVDRTERRKSAIERTR